MSNDGRKKELKEIWREQQYEANPRRDKWLLLQEKAMQKLYEVSEFKGYAEVFSFWKMPSFSSSSRCAIYTPWSAEKGERPFASHAIWRSDLDWAKLESIAE